jgi:hypothetical protein
MSVGMMKGETKILIEKLIDHQPVRTKKFTAEI